MTDAFDVKPQGRFSQHANLAFDLSMNDIFGALCHGATLCPLASEVDRLMPARIRAYSNLAAIARLEQEMGLIA
jgi:D-alanine--poly(phosphoribitol) ligase subunit 1